MKKKRFLSLLMSLIMLLGLMSGLSFSSVAITFGKGQDGDFIYVQDFAFLRKGVSVTGYTGTDTKVTVPAKLNGRKVISVDECSFTNKTNVTEVIISEGIKYVRHRAFSNCTNLKSVTLPSTLYSVSYSAFGGCTNLTDILFSEGLQIIGDNAFSGCTGLTDISLPGTVTSIGGRAFFGCSNLTEIYIPATVTSIGDGAFCHCSNLTNIIIDENNESYITEDNILYSKDKTELTYIINPTDNYIDYTVPDCVRVIGGYAFSDCGNLKSVTVSKNVKTIEKYAFWDCKNLENVNILGDLETVESSAFCDCRQLVNINLPDSVTAIGSAAFKNCKNLKNIHIPNTLTEINSSTFEGCSSLKEVIIPDSVTKIGFGAFEDCTGLKNIEIPDSLKEIEDYAFYNTGLTSVTIPQSVEKIGNKAFGYKDFNTKVDNFTIYGYEGSAAEKYANDNGFIFIAITEPECAHENTEIRNEVKATCVSDGYTGDVYCADCGELISTGNVIPALGHTDENKDGRCDVCGEKTDVAHVFICSMCPTYEKMKDVPVVGIIYSVVHFFVHLAEMISRIT